MPEVVCYKGARVSYEIAKRLIKVPYISLVNLIMDKPVVKELIQQDMNAENVRAELDKLLHDEAYRARIERDYASLKQILQQGGDASANAAASIDGFIAAGTAPAGIKGSE